MVNVGPLAVEIISLVWGNPANSNLRPLRLGEEKKKELECGPMPNVMVALPNIGGALSSTPQSLADTQY